ncbi:MAG: TRAM domain-containing protein [Clostridia bacterium]|nr:TRAM domain-containing protein [Clostridia bacterium]
MEPNHRMHSVETVLRVLLTMLGVGVGAALAAGILHLINTFHADLEMPLVESILAYLGLCVLFGLIAFAFSYRLATLLLGLFDRIYRYFLSLPPRQLISAIVGLIAGLLVAVLLGFTLRFMGSSMFTTAASSILTISLGAFGYSIGRARGDDILSMLSPPATPQRKILPLTHRSIRRASKKRARIAAPRLLDPSSLIDGRLLSLYRAGFLDGELIVPQFVVQELHLIADSQDPVRRMKGRRGLDVLAALQQLDSTRVRILESETLPEDDRKMDVDVELLRLSRETSAPIITCDNNLQKLGAVSNIQVLNLHELALMLRPVYLPGQTLQVQVMKEGSQPGQGVGYTEDGTMIVVENGQGAVGQAVTVQITKSLQTASGHMIFARISTT